MPFLDRTHRFHGQWCIRARSYTCLLDHVVRPMERGGRLKIVDLGAGNCWLSHRLADRGHFVAAVDIGVGEGDGLTCFRHYPVAILPVQAEFDRLPWPRGQFDLGVFNASLHYSTDLEKTLSEALRVLRQGGVLAVMDTPIYRDPASGVQMVRAREREFSRRFGFPSDALPLENYLAEARLRVLGRAVGVTWQSLHPRYGWRWRLRPWRARLTGRREPAQFRILLARKDFQ